MKRKLERIRKHPSLKDEAHQRIKTLILSGGLDSGDMLDIEWLVSELGISRTPVREALLRLEQEGLVETIPYKGTFVVDVSKRDVEEIYQVREVLQSLAIRLATPLIPDEELKEMKASFTSVADEIGRGDLECYIESVTRFQDLITRHCGNVVLQEILGTLNDRIYRVRVFWRNRADYEPKQSLRERCLILDAIMERDSAKAERLMAEHIRNAGKRIVDLFGDRS